MSGLSSVSIAIADEDSLIRQLLKNALRELGFRKIYIAENGEAILDTLKLNPVDILLTEWDMDPMDGISLCRFLRTNPKTPNRRLPIIMITGRSGKDDVEIARDSGVTEYLTKPFTMHRLCDRITAVVEKPRDFVLAPAFKGPDRRRRDSMTYSGEDRRTGKVRNVSVNNG